jgi:hypothetical protein
LVEAVAHVHHLPKGHPGREAVRKADGSRGTLPSAPRRPGIEEDGAGTPAANPPGRNDLESSTHFAATATISTLVLAACATDPTTSPATKTLGGPTREVTGPVDLPTKTCPNTGVDGWTKIDAGAGSASGAWGSLSYAKGKTVAITLNQGYELDVCVKSGSQVNDGEAAVYTVTYDATQPIQYITIDQAISHTRLLDQAAPATADHRAPELEVAKGAVATFKRTYAWTLTKQVANKAVTPLVYVDALPLSGTPLQAFAWDWKVDATVSRRTATGS